MTRFLGRVALVTGGGHGIGRATALRLGLDGATVAVIDVQETTAQETVELLEAEGIDSISVAADISDPNAVADAVAETAAYLGRIDILHSNAGTLLPGGLLEQTLEEWERTFAVNVRGMFLVARAVVPIMRAGGRGAIVNTASVSGLVGEAGLVAYCASKGAVVSMTRQLAVEFARDGIRVNCVCPGWIDSGFNEPMLAGTSETELSELVDRSVPLGRQGTPEEVAAAVAFLASDDASYVTGHALVADGGLTAL